MTPEELEQRVAAYLDLRDEDPALAPESYAAGLGAEGQAVLLAIRRTLGVVDLLVQSGDWLYVPRAQRSQTRETIAFWGALFSTALTLATLIVLVSGN